MAELCAELMEIFGAGFALPRAFGFAAAVAALAVTLPGALAGDFAAAFAGTFAIAGGDFDRALVPGPAAVGTFATGPEAQAWQVTPLSCLEQLLQQKQSACIFPPTSAISTTLPPIIGSL